MPPIIETCTKENTRGWHAWFQEGARYATRKVEIVKTCYAAGAQPYYWCMVRGVGTWPGTDSDEWIEYVPAPVEVPFDLMTL